MINPNHHYLRHGLLPICHFLSILPAKKFAYKVKVKTLSPYTYPLIKGNGAIYNLASQRLRVQLAPYLQEISMIGGKVAVLYSKIRYIRYLTCQLTLIRQIEWGVISLFSKKHHHLITLLLVFGCAVCVQICVLLFCFILTPAAICILTSSIDVTQDFQCFVQIIYCQKPLF